MFQLNFSSEKMSQLDVFPNENSTDGSEISNKVHWIVEFQATVANLTMSLCVAAIVSSIMTYMIALSMKDDQSSIVTLKNVAIFDSLHSIDIIQRLSEPLKC